MNNKQEKIAQQIFKQLALILQQEVRDPRIGMVTISEVELSKDISFAKIYVTSVDVSKNLSHSTDNDSVIKILNGMAGFLRTELAAKIKVRSVPALKFYYNTLIDKSNKIEELLSKIKDDSKFT